MDFIIATISGMFASAGGWIAAVLAAIAALFGGVVYHKTKVSKAEDQGKEDGAAIERDRIQRGTQEETNQIREKADEIEDEVRRDTATHDDLVDRLRRESTDYSGKP